MIFALATLTFITTLWAIIVVAAVVFDRSGGKVLAALKGQSMDPALATPVMRLRHRERERTVYRATPRLRAAA